MRYIKRTFDPALIKAIYKQDDLYSEIMDDGEPAFEAYIPSTLGDSVWLVLFKDTAIAGLVRFDRVNNSCWNGHALLFKEFRGYGSDEWIDLCWRYMQKNHNLTSIVAITDVIAAIKWLQKGGFNIVGELPNSIKKKGELHTMTILEKH